MPVLVIIKLVACVILKPENWQKPPAQSGVELNILDLPIKLMAIVVLLILIYKSFKWL